MVDFDTDIIVFKFINMYYSHKISTAVTIIKNASRDKYNKWLRKHNPKKLSEYYYSLAMGEKLDWNNPVDLNAKIQWLKFYGDTQLWAKCADKYCVREYVKERGFDNLLVKLYGKWDSVDEISWSLLPDQFIIKVNNGCGGNITCKNKNECNLDETSRILNGFLNEKYSDLFVEPHYALIQPCIIAEELLNSNCQQFESQSMIDYKVWCFDGEPLYICVYHDRTPQSIHFSIYDTNWCCHPEKAAYPPCFYESKITIPKPDCLSQLLEAASALSKGHPEVRVDFYIVNNKLYFGEMTFTSYGGYMNYFTKEMLIEMGKHTILPIKN